MATLVKLRPVIDRLGKCGLPVRFYQFVEQRMAVERGGSDQDEVGGLFTNTLKLSPETLAGLTADVPGGASQHAVHTMFHEGTHAYLILKKADPEVARLLMYGREHYRNTRLEDGSLAKDPDRITHEAAADYVGGRAAGWWEARVDMTAARRDLPPPEDALLRQIGEIVNAVRKIPQRYNKKMGEAVFGYQQGIFGNQIHTKVRIPARLKEFCDRVILEGKIPDDFRRVKAFEKDYLELLKLVKPLEVAPRLKRGA